MTTTRFDPTADLIIVAASVWGHGGRRRDLRLALDTGSSETLLLPEVTDDLGYSPRQGDAITVVRSALGSEAGYTLRVARFASLGFAVAEYRTHIHDLPDGFGIDGLLGLSFLRRLDYQVRSSAGLIVAERAA